MAKRKASQKSFLIHYGFVPKMLQLFKKNPFDSIPDEALFRFFLWVPDREIGTFACTCQRWARMARNNNLWYTLVENRWTNIPIDLPLKDQPHPFVPQNRGHISWRDYYMLRSLYDQLDSEIFDFNHCLKWGDSGELEGLLEFIEHELDPNVHDPSLYGFVLEMSYVYVKNSSSDEVSNLLNKFQDNMTMHENLHKDTWRVVVHKVVNLISSIYLKFEGVQKEMISLLFLLAGMEVVSRVKTKEDKDTLRELIRLVLEIIQDQILKTDDFISCNGFCVQDEETTGQVALQCLDTVAFINSKFVAPIVYIEAKKLFQSDKPEVLISICALIGVMAEGLTVLKENLDEFLLFILKCLQHEHENVVKAAFIAIGLLCNSWSPDLQRKYHSILLPEYIRLIDDDRYSAYVCSSLSSFFRDCNSIFEKIDNQTINALWPKLLKLVPTEELAISAFSTLSVAGAESCQNYLSPVILEFLVPVLVKILPQKSGVQYLNIMECFTCCCLSSGKEKFQPYLEDTLRGLLRIDMKNTQNTVAAASCWLRMLESLEEDIAPYLPVLMPKLLEFDEPGFSGQSEVHNLIIQILYTVPQSVKPWMDTIQRSFQTAIDYHNSPQELSNYISLIKTQEENGILVTEKTASHFLRHFVHALAYPDPEDSDGKCLMEILKSALSLQLFDPIPSFIQHPITAFILCWIQVNVHNEEDSSNLTEDQLNMLGVFEEVSKKAPLLAWTIIKEIFLFLNFKELITSPGFQVVFLCIFTNFLEYSRILPNEKGLVQSQIDEILVLLFERAQDPMDQFGQSAAMYGLGITAQKLTVDFERVLGVEKTVAAIKRFINNHSNEVSWIWDNGVGALGRILKAFPSEHHMNLILPYYVPHLPLINDMEENLVQYEIFAELLTRDDFPATFKSHHQMPQILNCILQERGCSDKTRAVATQVLYSLK